MTDQGGAGSAPEMQPTAELLPLVYAELRRLAAYPEPDCTVVTLAP
jgi:hypothetical protein